VIDSPIRTASDVKRIRPLEPDADLPYVLDAVTTLSNELKVPLVGFGGAPFTLASYLVEGGPSKNHARTKALMYSEPEVWHKLMDRLAEVVATYLQAQVRAGAAAIQLFDSWVGQLAPEDFRSYVAPSVQRILASLEGAGVPRIYFGVGTGELLADMATLGTEVVGVDWRVPLDAARQRVGEGVALQGNLDPTVCLAPWEIVEERARDILERTQGRKHIFNLGHGVLPETDPDTLSRLVDFVHAWEPDR
jgi:uroporphyrinogen decarboxylase